ncbi:MAG: hypothetical protein PHW25_02985 [Zoogloea sp.]|uniref:DUF1302 family protein n=1 Tax=Zoogloea sp. TaxID=49181 RepID=UPI002616A3A0|nr:DUF1302 family protein [Zoogloea sp.]MDD3326034.1 hypothetical protein [Zoogloea sp.]
MTHIFRRSAAACSMVLCIASVQAADDELALDESAEEGARTTGILQFDVARTYARPEHWSMARARAELTAQGGSQGVTWKISGRADADAVFAIDSGFYPDAVRRDQQYQFDLRETYLDFSAGDVDIRLGRQHIVWGEMVGLFFADVVSARDLRTFYLPDFEQLRIPQWAARAEYYFGDTHAELVWIPVPSYDRIGKPGAEFYPLPLPQGTRVRGEVKPDNTLGNGNWGARLSRLVGGWDVSGFYYRSLDVAQTFYQIGNEFEPRHDRITQIGGTMAKDFGEFVLKGEMVHARGRKYNTFNPVLNPDGLVAQNTMDYAFGVDIPAFRDGRVNLQYFGRRTFDHNPAIGLDRVEDGASVLLNTKLATAWEGEVLYVSMLKRTDFMLRPRVIWSASKNWRLVFGADVFGGDATGAFGRYSDRDRVYTEARWSF